MKFQTGGSTDKPDAKVLAPQVTLVVPSFNQGRYLEDALRSITTQDVATEIIVMDGGSTDNTLDVL